MAEEVLEKQADGIAVANGKKKKTKTKTKTKSKKVKKKKRIVLSNEAESAEAKPKKKKAKKPKKPKKIVDENDSGATDQADKSAMQLKKKKKKSKKRKRALAEESESSSKPSKSSKISKESSTEPGSKKDKPSTKKKKKKKKQKKSDKKKQNLLDPASITKSPAAENATENGGASTTKNDKSRSDPAAVKTFRDAHKISIHLPNAAQAKEEFPPVTTFDLARAVFPPNTLGALNHCCKTFDKPSPIQAQAWPIVLTGRDLIGVAATGSGKTLAFVLPGIAKLLSGSGSGFGGSTSGSASCPRPRMLVLSPTRELAIQSAKVLQEACEVIHGMEAMVIFGGQPKREQRGQLQQFGSSLDMIVATPGRLLDFIEDGAIELGGVTYLVLDEADRMLDMGFEKDVKRIIGMCAPSDRQTVMFSATWPQEIRTIASTYLTDAVRIVVGSEKLSASSSVKQHVEVIEPFAKEKRLKQLLAKIHDGKNRVIVFGLYKKECTRLEQNLLRQGFQVAGIHGDKAQHQREDAVRRFEKGELPILVATDVASRGLDIENVEYVVNYSFPLTVEDYVHRIGRTGRAGKRGVAYTFFTNHDKHLAGGLQNVLRQAGADIPEALSKFGNTVKKKTHKMYGAHFRQDDRPMKKATRIVFD